MAALDGLTSLVPAALAELLGWPQLTLADEIAVTEGPGGRVVRVRRETSTDVEVLTAPAARGAVGDRPGLPRPLPGLQGDHGRAQGPRDHLDPRRPRPRPLRRRRRTAPPPASCTAQPRPERPDRVVVTGDAETVPALVDYLSQKGFS